MLKKLVKIIIACFIGVILQPQSGRADSPGSAGYQFLRTYTGARPASMGGAFGAVTGDIHSINFNPAGIAALKTRGGAATYMDHVLDLKSGFIAYHQPFINYGTAGLAVNYLNYGELKRTDISGEPLGTFSANNIVISGSFGRPVTSDLLIGVNAKFIYFGIDSYNSSAVAFDGGVIYQIPTQDLNLGISIFNIGMVTSAFIETKDDLPINVRAGFSKRLAHLPLLLNGGVYKYIDDDWQWQLGGEFTLAPKAFLRLGFDSVGKDLDVGTGKDALAGVSIGFGLIFQQLHFDFAFTSVGEIGSQNRISISSNF